MKFLFPFVCALCLLSLSSEAAFAAIKYYPDPVYQKMAPEDGHPMDEIEGMAKAGDVRAQFIMGDLYSKGKGGLPKNLLKSREWFENSAIHGYDYSFLRLAAMEKREKKYLEAWKWYTIAIRRLDYGDLRTYILKSRKELTEKNKISEADMSKMSKAVKAWEDKRTKQLAAEHKAEVAKKLEDERKQKESLERQKKAASISAKEQQAMDEALEKELLQETVVMSELENEVNN